MIEYRHPTRDSTHPHRPEVERKWRVHEKMILVFFALALFMIGIYALVRVYKLLSLFGEP
jgi:hypothetical protein